LTERKVPERPRRTTLRDVARAAGVSIWTASNTFSNPARVAEATRQRVLAAADELDFAGPNPGARSLALGETRMVAFVAPGEAQMLLGDPAAALVARGLLSACDGAGLSLVLTGQTDGQLVDGRVFFRGPGDAPARGPVVVVDGPAPPGVPHVGADVRTAAAELGRLLLDLGHRDIAVIAHGGADDRLTGAADALGDLGPLAVYRTGGAGWATQDDGEAAARAALARTPRPTALLALSDTLAMGALDAAHRLGLHVPGDVSIAGLDDLPGSDARGLTTALVAYRPLGELAGDVLMTRLAGRPARVFPDMPAPLVVRATTGPPPA
jgi:DNA-binding LacI/PurR family transcriptional regulator